MASSNRKDHIGSGAASLRDSLSRLSVAKHILDGFVHRNKNQHRHTSWWGRLHMLRSNVRRLIPDLEVAVRRAELESSSALAPPLAPPLNKRRRTIGHEKPATPQRVAERAQWLHDVFASKAYGTFTQLAADRQFAQLGLMLIGLLAQVEAALLPLVRPLSQMPEHVGIRKQIALPTAEGVLVVADASEDLGVPVARSHGAFAPQDQQQHRSLSECPPLKEKLPKENGRGQISDPTLAHRRLLGTTKPGESRPAGSEDEKKTEKRKKRKKNTKDDELDNLFSSLI